MSQEEQKITENPKLDENQVKSYAMIETHLQVTNLIKILQTLNFELLNAIVESSTEELKQTSHYQVLLATRNFHLAIQESTPKTEE